MEPKPYQVFFSYAEANLAAVETLARRLRGDVRVQFWLKPWHAVPGMPLQPQMLEAFQSSGSCAIFLGGASPKGFQDKQIQLAILRQTEEDPDYRVIPVLLPGMEAEDPEGFLGLYTPVRFSSLDDEQAFKMLMCGIFGIPPIRLDGFVRERVEKEALPRGLESFPRGHALSIGVANYPRFRPLRGYTLNDASDMAALLTDPSRCGYPEAQVKRLLDGEASITAIRTELKQLAARTGPEDTAVVFFSGHGGRTPDGRRQYLLPYDAEPGRLDATALSMEEFRELLGNIRAGRLLVVLDCCHAGGAAESKAAEEGLDGLEPGLDEEHVQLLRTGRGRVVLASCRPEEKSFAERGSRNSIFTHFLLQALRGEARTLGDGVVRVFDLFRHVSDKVPPFVSTLGERQTPLFKADALDSDFAVAVSRK
ncbi:caspase family protein [Archangium lansingense]|uniref:Caspase family protein n=1 Tax=Archangium lansingense TaxID=2995310 RepID=A0ABT4AR57_9BACT|nr:caspase family protein [Archangium lansinium]MCY1083644.1 caspase family protein [Archangium lansinium]